MNTIQDILLAKAFYNVYRQSTSDDGYISYFEKYVTFAKSESHF